jgi:hypothetical protein
MPCSELCIVLLLLLQVGDAASISFKRMSTFGKRHLLTARPFSAVQTQVGLRILFKLGVNIGSVAQPQHGAPGPDFGLLLFCRMHNVQAHHLCRLFLDRSTAATAAAALYKAHVISTCTHCESAANAG